MTLEQTALNPTMSAEQIHSIADKWHHEIDVYSTSMLHGIAPDRVRKMFQEAAADDNDSGFHRAQILNASESLSDKVVDVFITSIAAVTDKIITTAVQSINSDWTWFFVINEDDDEARMAIYHAESMANNIGSPHITLQAIVVESDDNIVIPSSFFVLQVD